MRAFLLFFCIVLVSASNSANAGFLSRILDPQADIKERFDQARTEEEATDRERQARDKEERELQARKQEENDRVAKERVARELEEARGKPLAATYRRIPANLQALACSDPQQQADCKIYVAGFAHTVDLVFAMNPSMKGLCGDTTDLIHEFIQFVRTNPKAREAETHMVLIGLLARDHSCAKLKGRIQNNISAGSLIDMCQAGDLGFNLCSQYLAGFVSALLFLSEQTAEPILCGDERLINGVSMTRLLNERLQANFKLRRDPAVVAMLNELMENMPCPDRLESNIAPALSDSPPKDIAQLIARAERLNDKCRGGPGDDPATEKACGARDVTFRKIKAKNWCWGHDGQVGADRTWERCRK